jgi:hypothetical protein
LTKPAVCNWPTTVAAAWPGSSALTVPSLAMVMFCAVAGIVIDGCTGSAGIGDELAVGVDLEGTVARVGGGAVGHLHLEEALALDGQVVDIASLCQRPG